MSRGLWAAFLLSATLTFPGCKPPPEHQIEMSLTALNTANKILVVEGKTDLPSGSKLRAELQGRDGRVFLRDDAVVRRGGFFFDFDLDHLSEFSAYKVVVVFDPQRAPLAVRQSTGLWGEALVGPGIEDSAGRRVFRAQKEILLSTSAKGLDWEGRDFENMDGPERTRLVDELERYVAANEADKIAKLALARGYIASEPKKEKSVGSRAHQLLIDASRSPEQDPNGRLARKLLAEIEAGDKQQRKIQEARREAAKGSRYRTDFTVRPGTSLGGFRLGSPYEVAVRNFKVEPKADFQNGTEDQVVSLRDFHGVELTYGLRSRRLIAIRTTSSQFQLNDGVGVGSLVQELQRIYGTDVIPKPEYEYVTTTGTGKKIYRGLVETDGLNFEITREVDAEFGIPVDKVTALVVYPR